MPRRSKSTPAAQASKTGKRKSTSRSRPARKKSGAKAVAARASAGASAAAESDSIFEPCVSTLSDHEVECNVARHLRSHPALTFQRLTVRKIANGVCLSGCVEVNEGETDIVAVAREIAGVDRVVSQLIVRRAIPPKG